MTDTIRILHLIASPREASRSRAVAQAYLDALKQSDPTVAVEALDLWATALPAIDGALLSAKYAVLARRPHQPEEAQAWQQVQALAQHFLGFDHYVISVPMWNLGIPYRLKHYIDVITQPGMTFSWTPERGYEGLVLGRSALVACASAFDYSAESPLHSWDQQKTYVQTWLRFVGIEDVELIDCGPTRPGESGTQAAQARAEQRASRQGQTAQLRRRRIG